MKSLLVIILMNFAILPHRFVFAQVGPHMRHIKNERGLHIISNEPGNYFSIRIEGTAAARLHTPKKYWYTVDGIRFEFYSEENAKFVMTDVPQLDDVVVLRLYRSELIRRFANLKPKIRSSWLKLANGKDALLLSYEGRPASPVPVTDRQLFIVITGPMHVFGLFAPVLTGQTEAQVRRVLIRTLGTFAFRDEPIDISSPE
ncbi:MAG: hypothetical protein ACJ72Z_06245 [Pyrinomonadaceae bacterium]